MHQHRTGIELLARHGVVQGDMVHDAIPFKRATMSVSNLMLDSNNSVHIIDFGERGPQLHTPYAKPHATPRATLRHAAQPTP